MDESSILVSQSNGVAYIRVLGRGSFKNARYIKCFAEKLAELGTHRFVLDLGLCTHMDSTFMGVLAGLSLQARKNHSSPPRLVNVNPRNLELLQNLGLDRLLKVETHPVDINLENFAPLPASSVPANKEDITETMLEAHEALVQGDERNRLKFQDVITYLRDKLGVTAG